jgi:hypothetical protein
MKNICMPKAELANLYAPFSTQPVRTFMRWVYTCKPLMEELEAHDYQKTQKTFRAVHVAIIRKHLGDPEVSMDNDR